MRPKVQALYHDPANIYGFRLEADALELLTGAPKTPALPDGHRESSSGADRFGRMIRRNRDGLG